jgi:hypothetical protein
MSRTSRCAGAGIAVALLLAGCGSSSQKGPSSSSPPAAAGELPQQLLGEYSTTLKRSDLPPNPTPELTGGSLGWKLSIQKTGGVEAGPAFTISNDRQGELESSSPSATRDQITLGSEDCASTGDSVDSVYRWRLTGQKLTFTPVQNGCPDKVALTILTSEPWTKKR